MSIRRRIFITLAALGAATALLGGTAARANDLDQILAAKTIRIGVDLSIPPYGMLDNKLQPTGSEIDCAKLLASDLGVKLQLVNLTGANRVPFLLTDKVDVVMASFGITPEREKVIAFSKPYSVTPAAIGVPERIKIDKMADLAGKKVAVTRGTVNDQLLTALAPKGTQIMRFDDDSGSAAAILSGQADAFATAPPLLFALNKKDPNIKLRAAIILKYFRVGAGVRKADNKLRERINQWIDVNMKNGKLPAIYQKYFDAPLPMDQLNKP